jgi:mediator of RNA polymerase II transcription subunit 14
MVDGTVAQMAKRWPDVRLLSFDLQTVEFAYAADFVVSVACDDPKNPSAGSFHLHFSRLLPSTPTSPSAPTSTALTSAPQRRSYNPHSDAEPFFLHLLRNHPLSVLPFLVDVLRNTVPIVEVLEEIRAEGEGAMDIGSSPAAVGASSTSSTPYAWSWADVDTYPKSAGWWRASFGPGARHALDFRLMQGPRIVILDASYVLQLPPSQTTAHGPVDSALLLKPIPHMKEIVARAARQARRRGRVAVVGVGVVCEVRDAAALGRAVWAGVLAEFGVGSAVAR